MFPPPKPMFAGYALSEWNATRSPNSSTWNRNRWRNLVQLLIRLDLLQRLRGVLQHFPCRTPHHPRLPFPGARALLSDFLLCTSWVSSSSDSWVSSFFSMIMDRSQFLLLRTDSRLHRTQMQRNLSLSKTRLSRRPLRLKRYRRYRHQALLLKPGQLRVPSCLIFRC